MKVLVIGGTGTVGSQVCEQLLARDVAVRVLSRSAENVAQLPAAVEGVTGDLLVPESLPPAFRGIDAAFILNAVSQTESWEGLTAVNFAREAGVKHIAYLSVHHADRAPHVPNFGGKLPVEAAIAATGTPHTILRANGFYQNDAWFKEALLGHGVYPQPIGDVGVSRVDVRDIAEAAAIGLTGDDDNGFVNLAGPDVHTGADTARIWSEALGQPVRYAGNDLEAWERQAGAYMPVWMVHELKLMYAYFQEHGLVADQADIERLTALLGHPPRRFADFAGETAQSWA